MPDGQGAYYPPTVLIGCTPQMRAMREETFGPVPVVPDFDIALLEAVHDDYVSPRHRRDDHRRVTARGSASRR